MNEARGASPKRMTKRRRQTAPRQDAETDRTALRRERKQHRREAALRREAAQERREPLVVFVHIPKTAGGTAKSVFADAFGSDAVHDAGNYPRNPELVAAQSFQLNPRIRISIGHVPYGLFLPHLPSDTRYITFLREPVERVISHYYRHLDGKEGTRTLPEALEGGTPVVTNLMTRFLCGYGHPEALGELPDTAVDDAKAALESFFFVGFQDRFDESLVLLQERLGMPMTAYGASRHVNANRPSIEEVGEENLALIEEHNQLDVQLYAWACDRFGGDFEARGDELRGAVETLRDSVTEKTAGQAERTARAVQWLTEQVPPGTERPYNWLRAEAEKLGFTTRDLNQARRQIKRFRKVATDHGVMLVAAPQSKAVDASTGRAARRQRRTELAASPEAEAETAAAAQWLQEQLPPGTSRLVDDLVAAARAAGVPEDAVRRARLKMNLRKSLDDEGRKVWTSEPAGVQDGEAERATS